MAELEDTDPLMATAAEDLTRRVTDTVSGRPLDRHTLELVREVIYDHSVRFKQRYGHTFPRMVIIALPSVGRVDLYRADLDDAGIATVILNTARRFPSLPTMEIAAAVLVAWPGYRRVADTLPLPADRLN